MIIKRLFTLVLASVFLFGCNKDQLTNTNEPLVGVWRLTHESSELGGNTAYSKWNESIWKFYNDGTLKVYRHGILIEKETWKRDTIEFLGAYDQSSGSFEIIKKPVLYTSHMGSKVLSLSGDHFELISDYLDGGNLYFERK